MKNKLFKYLSLLSLILLFLVACSPKKVDQSKNPFNLEKTGLPHQTSFCGVGLPDLISSDLAESVIGKVFNDAGFKLTKNYLYEDDSLSFVLNGYDKDKKIGYVYLDYNNLEDDAIIPWEEWSFAFFNEPPEFDPENQKEGKIEKESERFARWLKSSNGSDIKNMINYMNKSLLASEQTLITEVRKSNNEKFIRSAYTKLYQKQKKYTLSFDEVKRIIKNEGQDGVYIAVISIYDKSLAVYPDYEIEEIEPDTTKESEKYTQEDALKYLKTNVNKFIEWSKI